MQLQTKLGVLLSICIPSFNRADKLSSLLRSISECIEISTIKRITIEVVVLLDGSTDNSEEIVLQAVDKYPVKLRVHRQNNQGLATARNKLAELADGLHVWHLDDDMEITVDALMEHYFWNRTNAPILTGPSYLLGDEWLALFYENRWKHLGKLGYIDKPQNLSFANTSAPRQLLQFYRFDDKFKGYGFEDYEYGIRLLGSGIRIAYSSSAKVIHYYDKTSIEILTNIRDEGSNRVKMSKLHPIAGRFALEVELRRYSKPLIWLTKMRLYRTLWFAALSTRIATKFCKNEWKTGLIRLANDMALHSGFAKQGGIPQVKPQSMNEE